MRKCEKGGRPVQEIARSPAGNGLSELRYLRSLQTERPMETSSIIQQELKQNRKRERRKDAPGGEILKGENGQDRDGLPGRSLPLRPDVPGLPQQRRHRRADAEADRHCGKAEGTW